MNVRPSLSVSRPLSGPSGPHSGPDSSPAHSTVSGSPTGLSSAPGAFGSRTDVHFRHRVTYRRIADAIEDGKLALHLINGRVLIEMAEADKVFRK
jgi:hypothetical protein